MKNHCYKYILALLSLTFCGCNAASTRPISPAPSSLEVTPTANNVTSTTKKYNYETKYADDLLSENEKLSYGNYQIEKHRKPTIVEGKRFDDDGHQFAVLKQKDKVVAQFDAIVNPLGTEIRFGLHSLLGDDRKQLIIEQTENRGWQYWIVDLNQEAKVIHNSGKYNVGQGLRVLDLDGDGKTELIQNLLTFWFFDGLANTHSPFPDIVFTYDPKSRQYVPANCRFRDFVLRDIEQHITKVRVAKSNAAKNDGDVPGDGDILGAMLRVLLEYIYASKEKEAWEFYEAEYNLPDKAEMKSKIKNKLKEDAVYQAISKLKRQTSK